MKKAVWGVALVLFAMFGIQGLRAADAPASVTLKGELLDLVCYMSHEGAGAEHADCAVKCVKGGAPMGLKAEDGKIYLVMADHKNEALYKEAEELAGKNVELTGAQVVKGDMNAILLSAVKAI